MEGESASPIGHKALRRVAGKVRLCLICSDRTSKNLVKVLKREADAPDQQRPERPEAEGSGTIEQRIEEAKQKAREMQPEDNG